MIRNLDLEVEKNKKCIHRLGKFAIAGDDKNASEQLKLSNKIEKYK